MANKKNGAGASAPHSQQIEAKAGVTVVKNGKVVKHIKPTQPRDHSTYLTDPKNPKSPLHKKKRVKLTGENNG